MKADPQKPMELDGQGRYPLWVYKRFLSAAEDIPGYRGFCGNLCIVINSIEKFLRVDAKTLQDTHEESWIILIGPNSTTIKQWQ